LGETGSADNGKAPALDVCFTLRTGTDVTLVTWGAMVKETMAEQMLYPKKALGEVMTLQLSNPRY